VEGEEWMAGVARDSLATYLYARDTSAPIAVKGMDGAHLFRCKFEIKDLHQTKTKRLKKTPEMGGI
jgi:hypothetical protein